MRELINIIFKKLSLRYGRDFTGKWEGIDLDDVKSDWALELDGFEKSPYAIFYALKNLPDSKPPNVAEFRNIALRAPEQPLPRLDAPQASPEIARKAIAEARALLSRAAQ